MQQPHRWGDAHFRYPLSSHPFFIPFLEANLGKKLSASPAMPEPAVPISKPRLPRKALERFRAIIGEEGVSLDNADRLAHSVGKSYKDLVSARKGRRMPVVDAVLRPATEEQIRRILTIASRHSIEVIPYGGGTSVLGGIEPASTPSVSVDMARFAQVRIDAVSHMASLGAGLRGPQAERALNAEGFTLGHFPQSFEFSTVGGWVATRSAGQASTKYGKIEDMVLGLRMVSPRGIIEVPPFPSSATGPDLAGLCVGSEGILGVITSATFRIHTLPRARDYGAFFFHDFSHGCEAIRAFMQSGARPAVVRLSDESETEASLALSQKKGVKFENIGRRLLSWRNLRCLLIIGAEGTREEVRATRTLCSRAIKAHGGMGIGSGAAHAWVRERFMHPYLRDQLLDFGICVDTLETAATWDRIDNLYRAMREAIRQSLESHGGKSFVMAHLSHAYPTGACLYFTFMAPQTDDELAQWLRVKESATKTILDCGGTLSHHHGIGKDHAPWLEAQVGLLGMKVLRRQKSLLDTRGIMNPGKVVPDDEREK